MKILDWGEVPYLQALEAQLEAVEKVARAEETERVVLCSHAPVVTLGRSRSSKQDLIGWSGEVVEVSRGGRATYHGPSQQLIYPILNLAQDHARLKARDIHAYLRCMEEILIRTLHDFGLKSEARTISVPQPGEKPLSLTGVWIGDKKIASIGVAVKKWVTYHGAALNVEEDPRAFSGINPCGFQREVMTSMQKELGEAPVRKELRSQIETWIRHYWG
jgi:lipoyl(octanoyl) transferase